MYISIILIADKPHWSTSFYLPLWDFSVALIKTIFSEAPLIRFFKLQMHERKL